MLYSQVRRDDTARSYAGLVRVRREDFTSRRTNRWNSERHWFREFSVACADWLVSRCTSQSRAAPCRRSRHSFELPTRTIHLADCNSDACCIWSEYDIESYWKVVLEVFQERYGHRGSLEAVSVNITDMTWLVFQLLLNYFDEWTSIFYRKQFR